MQAWVDTTREDTEQQQMPFFEYWIYQILNMQ